MRGDMQSGVLASTSQSFAANRAVGAVREVIERMSAGLSEQPYVFVTGGDLRHLAPLVSPHSQFVPNMVLSGIAISTNG